MTINNFEKINLIYDNQPPYLTQEFVHDQCTIYHSTFDREIYVIYNSADGKYYPFKNVGSRNIIEDLKKLVGILFSNAKI